MGPLFNRAEVTSFGMELFLPNNSTQEITQVIDPPPGMNQLVLVTPVPEGDDCTSGGLRIDIGIDDNDNGTLEDGEIDNARFVCNGADGLEIVVLVTPEPEGDNCTFGGQRIEIGLDDNRNGSLEQEEIDNTSFVCNGDPGMNGLNNLVVITTEEPGGNCEFGGQMIEAGLDDDSNGVLDQMEIDSTSFVCNGADGDDGQDGQDGQDGEDGPPGQDGQDGADGNNANCSIAAGPSSASNTAANWALLLLPVAMVIGVRAIRRRKEVN